MIKIYCNPKRFLIFLGNAIDATRVCLKCGTFQSPNGSPFCAGQLTQYLWTTKCHWGQATPTKPVTSLFHNYRPISHRWRDVSLYVLVMSPKSSQMDQTSGISHGSPTIPPHELPQPDKKVVGSLKLPGGPALDAPRNAMKFREILYTAYTKHTARRFYGRNMAQRKSI